MAKEVFWILGAGRFGSLAVRSLPECRGGCRLVAVDRDERRLAALNDERVERVQEDVIDYLLAHLHRPPDWIVPAIPGHVAFAWLRGQLAREGRVTSLEVPKVLENQVPHPFRGKAGGLYTSFATFICPDNCEEPAARCTVTGRFRGPGLFHILSRVEVPGFGVQVIRSHQLAPGVGGYQPWALWKAHEGAKSARQPSLVATACRCHGVVHALQFLGIDGKG
jgi:hypothetical protein